VDFRARFRAIRDYKKKSQTDMAPLVSLDEKSLSDKAWSHLETGRTKSLKFEQLRKLFVEAEIDPRYFFGFYDSIEQADLKSNPIKKETDIIEKELRKRPLLKLILFSLTECSDDILERFEEYLKQVVVKKIPASEFLIPPGNIHIMARNNHDLTDLLEHISKLDTKTIHRFIEYIKNFQSNKEPEKHTGQSTG
jgi:transcriptional regulator with XRE-family HTH domain